MLSLDQVVEHILVTGAICVALIALCVMLFYEILGHVWVRLPKLDGRPRTQIFVTIFSVFAGHTLAIWLFGLVYYVLSVHADFGSMHGVHSNELISYVYFSGATYSSVGFGDVYVQGPLRMIATVEVLLGLILIGWSVTFTYLVTDKFLLHKRAHHESKKGKTHG